MKLVQQPVQQPAENVVMLKPLLEFLDETQAELNIKRMACQVKNSTYLISPVKLAISHKQHSIYFTLVTNTLSAQILVPNASPSQPSSPVTKSQKVNKIANNLQKNFGAIQAALKKSRNQVRNLKKIFPQ